MSRDEIVKGIVEEVANFFIDLKKGFGKILEYKMS